MKCYLNVTSIYNILFTGYINKIYVTTIRGLLNIYPGHTALLTMTIPGVLYISTICNKNIYLYISDGILEVQPKLIHIIIKKAILGNDLNYNDLINKANNIKRLIKKNCYNDQMKLRRRLNKIYAKLSVINMMGMH